MNPLNAEKTRPTEGGASYSMLHRGYRLLWSFVWMAFAIWTPAPMHKWRIFLLRLFGAKVHWTAHVYPTVKVWFPSNLIMDEHSCLGPDVNCYNMAMIHLRYKAVVSQGAFLCGGTHDINDDNHQLVVRPIVLDRKSWVAAEAFVGPGVAVGKGAVLGARAVIFKDALDGGVYVGNPAELVKYRCVTNSNE